MAFLRVTFRCQPKIFAVNEESCMRMRSEIFAIALLMALPYAHAEQNSATIAPQKRLQKEIYGGVIVNQTVTVAGQDFYQHFVALWRDKPNSERYAVSVHERPSARWGSQVWVEYAQQRVFQAALPSMRASVQAVSEQAVDLAYQNVMDADVQRLLFRDRDIGPDEM